MMTEIVGSHRGWWPVFDAMPEGWRLCRAMPGAAGSPRKGCVFITDGVSPLKGGRRALLRVVCYI